VLIYIAEPLREDASDLPAIKPFIQDNFFQVLCSKFKELSTMLRSEDSPRTNRSDLMQITMLLSRFLQFDLAFRGIWTEKTKAMSLDLATVVFSLVQVLIPIYHGLMMS